MRERAVPAPGLQWGEGRKTRPRTPIGNGGRHGRGARAHADRARLRVLPRARGVLLRHEAGAVAGLAARGGPRRDALAPEARPPYSTLPAATCASSGSSPSAPAGARPLLRRRLLPRARDRRGRARCALPSLRRPHRAALRRDPLAGVPSCDLVACFGFMHHVPGIDLRLGLARALARRLAPGGLLACSFWRFMDDPHLAAKRRCARRRPARRPRRAAGGRRPLPRLAGRRLRPAVLPLHR